MLKRNLVLGGLIAGAFLLPGVGMAAGVVEGPCVQCHTMHDSQDGAPVNTGINAGQHAQLLKGGGCYGCHADDAVNGDATTGGRSTGGSNTGAPQVDYVANGYFNAAGYFRPEAAYDNYQHNVAGITSADVVLSGVGTIPGGGALNGQVTCDTATGCHTQQGAHHNSGGSYRMLGFNAAGTSALHEYNPGAAGSFPGNRSAVAYGTPMNDYCARCHSTFHTAQASGGDWVRHPTDVRLSTAGGSVVASITANDAVVTGINDQVAGETDHVLCLSCHVAHGGAYPNLLSFSYGGSGSYAGDNDANSVSEGCETCHSYGGNGM